MVAVALLWVLDGQFKDTLWYRSVGSVIRVGDIVYEKIVNDCTFLIGYSPPPGTQEDFDRDHTFRCKVILLQVNASMLYAVFSDALGILVHQYHARGKSLSAKRDAKDRKYSPLLKYLRTCGGEVMYIIPPFGYEERHRIVVPTENTPIKFLEWPHHHDNLQLAARRQLHFDV